jgi:uncharacterized protein (DUF952 family)
MSHEYRDSDESKNAGITYHLALVSEWNAQKDSEHYVPGAYEGDGFIHCTNGLDMLTEIANMFYKNSPDERTVLVLDIERIASDLRYDDEAQTFPHIYGPLNTSAVIGELQVNRIVDGTFVSMGSGS